MRGVLSLDLILTGIFILGMYGIANASIGGADTVVEEHLAKPVCLAVANDVARSISVSGVYPAHWPSFVKSVKVQGNTVDVNVSVGWDTYSCTVSVP
jgi:hypothetical protein